MQRPFTSGSRQAPDPFDQFLEEQNFYRKHTARDASCLFRVISEQMYDTQLHHLAIRKKCVRYMRKHRKFFQPLVDRDLDDYLDDMSKPKTYGTLVELQAVGYMFQRNVLLFEPFNLGNYFNHRSYLNDVFQVFYTPERHFDSVFTCDYIKDAAICQSICYEILYKDLYKLPDVSYAVEQMLHAPTFESSDYHTECNADGYCTRIHLPDGRIFDFDMPQSTNCILENYKLCHFHYTNFPRLSDDLQRELKIYTNRDDGDKSALSKTAESLLPHKYISCVRQLLQEGITPFPYKVAKALDPNMYRNIEFDAWNEARKELKLQNWYNGDTNFKLIRYHKTRVHKIFQVGAKCHVKLRKSENDLYTCHIQEIAVDKGYCIVFIEQLGEKRLVPYDSLTPLPPDQFKPWSLPYRFQRHMHKYSSVRFTRHYNYRFKFNGQFSSTHEYCGGGGAPQLKGGLGSSAGSGGGEYCDMITDDDDDSCEDLKHQHQQLQHRNNCYYKLKQFTHLENFRTHTVEYCTMPLTVEQTAPRELLVEAAKSGGGGGGGGARGTPCTEPPNSRAPSRSSNKTDCGGGGGSEHDPCIAEHYEHLEQAGGAGGGLAYMPEFHCFYPMQYAGGVDDYYGYGGYDAGLQPIMHAGNGGAGGTFYYMCNSAGGPPGYHSAAGNNFYMQAPTPMQAPPHPLLTAAPPNAAQSCAGGGGNGASNNGGGAYYSNPYYSNSTAAVGHFNSGGSLAYNHTPALRGRGGGHNSSSTPLSGRINWDAKRSVKANGVDLPPDVATLRYFYNLGLDYHHKLKRSNDDAIDSKEHVAKLAAEMQQNMKIDDNSNVPESKADLRNLNNQSSSNSSSSQNPNNQNTQNAITSNQNQNNQSSQFKSNHSTSSAASQQRRFTSRYFNSKDRQNYQRNYLAPIGHNGQSIRYQNEYNSQKSSNSNNNNNNSTTNNVTPNSSRQHMPPNSNSNMAHPNAEQPIQTSPMIGGNYEATNMPTGVCGGGGDAQVTPNTAAPPPQPPHPPHYNMSPNPAVVTYGSGGGSYDYAIDPNAPGAHLTNAPPPGGVYIQMPMAAASAYGIYAAAPQPQGGPPAPYPGAYMGPPPPPPPTMSGVPPPTVNGFYAPAPLEGADNGVGCGGDIGVGAGGGMHFQCMGYPPPPPIQFYYSTPAPSSGGGVGSGVVGNPPPPAAGGIGGPPPHPTTAAALVGPQAYWGPPPPPPPARNTPKPSPAQQAQQSTNNNSGGCSSGGGSNTTPTMGDSSAASPSQAPGTNNTRDKPQTND